MIPPFPLLWPEGQRRTQKPGDAQFRTTRSAAMDNVEKSLAAFARDSNIRVSGIQITSNVAGVRGEEPQDAGVAVWFEWDGDQRCIAIDRYRKVDWNLQAIHHIIEADRTKIRHGGLEIVRASFRGLAQALPAPGSIHWTATLGIGPDSTPDQITAAYRAKARELGATGNDAARAELNVARDKALAERGAK
jgi:hypothetical protein